MGKVWYDAGMELFDTHCHIHEAAASAADRGLHEAWKRGRKPNDEGVILAPDPDEMIGDARKAGVASLLCVGCTPEDSAAAIEFVRPRPGTWASIGIHPHEAQKYVDEAAAIKAFAALAGKPKVVAVGECGLDYFYNHSPKAAQEKILRLQIELALEHDLLMVFHVRDAFADFWPIFDSYEHVRGVIHSFTAGQKELDEILARGLYVGQNGITTFMKDPAQLAAAKAVPLERLLLETDAPFLTPNPYRGTVCEPKHVRLTAEFLSQLRGIPLGQLAEISTQNAHDLFLRTRGKAT